MSWGSWTNSMGNQGKWTMSRFPTDVLTVINYLVYKTVEQTRAVHE